MSHQQRTCAGCSATGAFSKRCPNCSQKGVESYFCSQDCFTRSWKEHNSTVHKQQQQQQQQQPSSAPAPAAPAPFPGFNFSFSLLRQHQLHPAYEPLSSLSYNYEPQMSLHLRLQKLNALCVIADVSPADVIACASRGADPPLSWMSGATRSDPTLPLVCMAEHMLNPVQGMARLMGADAAKREAQAAEEASGIIHGASMYAKTKFGTAFGALSYAAMQRSVFEKQEEALKLLKTFFYSIDDASSSSAENEQARDYLYGNAISELAAIAASFTSEKQPDSVHQVFRSIAPKLSFDRAARVGASEAMLQVARFLMPQLATYFGDNYHVLATEFVSQCFRSALVGNTDAFITAVRKQLLSGIAALARNSSGSAIVGSASSPLLLSAELEQCIVTVVLQLWHGGYCIAGGEAEAKMLSEIETLCGGVAQQQQQSQEHQAWGGADVKKQRLLLFARSLLSQEAWTTSLSDDDCDLLSLPAELRLQRQLLKERREIAKSNFGSPSAGVSADSISQAVASFYTEHVYPAWTQVPFHNTLVVPSFYDFCSIFFGKKAMQLCGAVAPAPAAAGKREAILVAGCGSGHHIATLLRQHPQSLLVGIDLSPANLAYAQQRLHGSRSRVKLFRKDILSLDAAWCNQQDVLGAAGGALFDAVECYGVLHHMQNPQDGLAALHRVLKPGGLLSLSVYSHAATEAVEQAKEWIQQQQQQQQQQQGEKEGEGGGGKLDVPKMRAAILSLPNGHPVKAAVVHMSDFYSHSGFCDMLSSAHPCVHRYTIKQLFELVQQQGYRILGMQVQSPGVGMISRMCYSHLQAVANKSSSSSSGPVEDIALMADPTLWAQTEREVKAKTGSNLGVMYNVYMVNGTLGTLIVHETTSCK